MPSERRPPSHPGASLRARVGWALVAVIAILLPLIVRVWIDGRAELRDADAAAEIADQDAEIRHLGRAARFRLPIAGHDELALARLAELGEAADTAGDHDLGLAAWRELRGALIGTRVVDVADPELLARANAAIVDGMVRQARAEGRPTDPDRWTAELEQDLAPRGRTLLSAAMFVAWLGACLGFFARAIDGKGRLAPRPALRWGAAVVITLIAWILI